MSIFVYDPSIKGIPLQALPESAWHYLIGQPEDDNILQPLSAFKRVAWVYRGVDMRAKAVAKLPYALIDAKTGEDLPTTDPRYQRISKGLAANLYRTEAALCLYGKSYWMKDRNVFGLGISPRWLLPASIAEQYDKQQGLTGFTRTIDAKQKGTPVKLENVVYFWSPNLEAEIGPGQPCAKVAMMAAGVLYNLDLYLDGYFKRGAIKATLLTVEGNSQPQEVEKLEAWWKRAVSGVKNAWTGRVLRSTVKPVIIGDGLKDTVNPALNDQAREDIATALGIPHSLMRSDALAGGTAAAEQVNFYDQTVIPEYELIADAANDQWLRDEEGVELVGRPNKLEIYQTAEVQKAHAVSSLVGRPILTVNEGRALLGYKDLPPDQVSALVPSTVRVKPAQMQLSPDKDPSKLPSLEPVQPGGAAGAAKALDLDRWERKAMKRLRDSGRAACSFASEHISAAEHARIVASLGQAQSNADIKAVFAKARAGRVTRSAIPEMLDAAALSAARQRIAEARA